jgi:hypothetical protein
MAASAGTLIAVGKSGRSYSIDLYIPDAVATLITFGVTGNAASTSSTTWRVPEDVTIVDIATPAAPTATTVTLTANGAAVAGGVLRWTNQLNTLSSRVAMRIPIGAGTFLGGLQA